MAKNNQRNSRQGILLACRVLFAITLLALIPLAGLPIFSLLAFVGITVAPWVILLVAVIGAAALLFVPGGFGIFRIIVQLISMGWDEFMIANW
jgi:uncharacterized membrane protein